MMQLCLVNTLQLLVVDTLHATYLQPTIAIFLTLFGTLIISGIILYFFARSTRRIFIKTAGLKFDIFFTGWLGVPVHELGHAFFCLIFFHKITEIKLFAPNTMEGTLGYVTHSYNKKNPMQIAGNFFIGIGPIIFGSLVLFALLWFLLPDKQAINAILSQPSVEFLSDNFSGQASQILKTGKIIFLSVVSSDNIQEPLFWLFLYLSLCIVSHMQLSLADIKSSLLGILIIFLLLLLVTFFVSFFNGNILPCIAFINSKTGVLTGILIFAVFMSVFNFLLSYIPLSIYSLIRYKKFLNPFIR
ncbi:MAG: hypothetical protein A2275_08485 [Bacteroidetes bacterium RIFOXYA12_FULL_35_11]|nr:MAG: hypothetical protein A2X01_09300 [Bacteroidetes bacterium GWF2_35_48]OFY75965.1 MAG: hypothetical protein A2275_08485 [Bacteroidetes bacterium RIFOXYA12_FULL_35_11]OFY94781.1 MAG: hypothetical protein A2309_07720 [Bacteroidetes bacterium RIFOXYB2_FULL_35_7]